uniref:Zinc ribbon domain-containing protein n=1 Tax=Thermofilum pendens TaxID=2269 RepID=A0A7C4B8S0_THEPE
MRFSKGSARPRQDSGISGRDPSPDELFSRIIAKARQLVMIIAIAGVVASLLLALIPLLIPAADMVLVSPFVAAALAVSVCTYTSYEVARRVADAYAYKLYVRLTSANLPPVREISRAAEGTQVLVKPVMPAAHTPFPSGPPTQQPLRAPRSSPVAVQPTVTTVAVSQSHETVVQPARPTPRIQTPQAPLARPPTCPQCGRELPYGDLHLICPFCGFRLK